jgi:hypothetical protein
MLTIRLLIPAAPGTPTPSSPVEGQGIRWTTGPGPSLPPCGGGSGWDRLDWWRARTARITPPQLGRAALLYAAFFVIGGVLLWLLTLAASGPGRGAPGLLVSISALALAWIVGFVTPGSSAGFRVREAVLIVVLQVSLDREAGVLVALALRLVTLAGDLLLFVASLALPLPDSRSRQDSIEI